MFLKQYISEKTKQSITKQTNKKKQNKKKQKQKNAKNIYDIYLCCGLGTQDTHQMNRFLLAHCDDGWFKKVYC